MQTTPTEGDALADAVRLMATGSASVPDPIVDFRIIAEKSLSLIIVADFTGSVQYVNKAFCEATGFSAAEVIGQRVNHLGHLDAETRAEMWETLGIGLPWRGEFSALTKAGRKLWFESSISPIADDDGRVTHFIAFGLDITERKRDEEALRRSEERFRRFTESVPVATFIGQGTGFRFANSAMEVVFGYSLDELATMQFWDVVHPDHRDLVRDRGMARQRGENLPSQIEVKLMTKGGETLWGLCTAQPIVYEGTRAVVGTIIDITERKRAEEALRESEEKFRTLVDTMPAAAVIFQGNSVRYANRMTLDVMGYTADDLASLNYWDTVHPDDRNLVRERGAARLRGEDVPSSYEVRFLTKSGEVRWGLYSAAVITYEGKPAVIGTIYDITERKAAEDALRESEEKFRAIVETSRETIWASDLEHRILYVNPAVQTVLGYAPDELIGTDARDLLHPEDWASTEDLFDQLVSAGTGWVGIVARWRHKKGNWRYIETSGAPVFGADGRVTGFRGAGRDVTERMQAQEALRQSEERYRILYQDNPSMYFTLSEDLSVLSVNQHGAEQLGHAPEDLIGEPVLTVVHPDDQIHVKRQLEALVRKSGTKHGLEFRKVRKNGEVVWVKESVGVTHDADGARIILVVCEDITEHKHMQEALEGLREELERKAERTVAGKNPYNLSFRESTVLHLVTAGRSDKEIGVVLGIRPQTVSKHVANVLKKMNASSRTEAGVRALREGLIA